MPPFVAILGVGWGEVFWAAVSAFGVACAGFLAIGFRALLRRLAIKAKAAFVDWFGTAIDEHVAPQFEAIRHELHDSAERTQQNSRDSEARIKAEAAATAEKVKQELQAHTEVQIPLVEHLEETLQETQSALHAHMDADEKVTLAAKQALTAGQGLLISRMDEHHDELVAEMKNLINGKESP